MFYWSPNTFDMHFSDACLLYVPLVQKNSNYCSLVNLSCFISQLLCVSSFRSSLSSSCSAPTYCFDHNRHSLSITGCLLSSSTFYHQAFTTSINVVYHRFLKQTCPHTEFYATNIAHHTIVTENF